VIITGSTNGTVPTTPGAFDTTPAGAMDAFLTKFTADGTGLVFSTLMGGSKAEQAQDLAVDAAGNIYLGGMTNSYDFPTSADAFSEVNFSADFSPANATPNFTYYWYPEPLSGQGSASAAYMWTIIGTKTISVTIENAGSAVTGSFEIQIDPGTTTYLPLISFHP